MMYPYSDFYSPYDYDFGYSASQAPNLEMVAILYIVIFGIYFIGCLLSYLLRGFGLYGIAKRMGHTIPWLSFIPLAHTYLQGELAGEIKLGKKTLKHPGLWLLLVPMIAGAIFTAVYIAAIVAMVAYAAALDGMGALPGTAFFVGFFIFIIAIVLLTVVVSAVTIVIKGLVNYSIHKRYVSDNVALIHTLLGIFVPFYQTIYFFILRKRPLAGEKAQVSVTWQSQSITPVQAQAEDKPTDNPVDTDF